MGQWAMGQWAMGQWAMGQWAMGRWGSGRWGSGHCCESSPCAMPLMSYLFQLFYTSEQKLKIPLRVGATGFLRGFFIAFSILGLRNPVS